MEQEIFLFVNRPGRIKVMLDRAPNHREPDKRNPLDPFEGLQFAKCAKWGTGGIGFLVFASIVANYFKRSVTELMDKHEPTGVYFRGNASGMSDTPLKF